jgi:hypothetical protein
VKYLGVFVDKRNYIENTYGNDRRQDLSKVVSIYPLLKIERLSVNAELTLYKALIMCIMIYACPAW